MTIQYDIATIEAQAKRGERPWQDVIDAQHALIYPRCANHPERAAYSGTKSAWLCNECVEAILPRIHLYLKSQGVVQGGLRELL